MACYNEALEEFRDREYPMLKGKIYLDHGGTTIYPKSLIDRFSAKMTSNLYGNPHSEALPSQHSSSGIEIVRKAALCFFGADPEHFDLIFTANATAAIKLVAESLRDLASTSSPTNSFWYTYHKDSHTSLVGVRELADGQHHCFSSDEEVEEWLDGRWSSSTVRLRPGVLGLFAYPGQSNMTGRRLPLAWSRRLRESSNSRCQDIYTLLDAAALATTTHIDFSDYNAAPDFTAVSFYKIFGFPDLGGLIVRRASGHILLWRKYFGGGTVEMLSVFQDEMVHRKAAILHEALEDGTLPFHSIIALGCAMEVHTELYNSMTRISRHTSFLIQRLYKGMLALEHDNGQKVCVIYNDEHSRRSYEDAKTQGATIAFNLVDGTGSYLGHSIVESSANEKGIYLRSGGLCNPGGIASHLKVEAWQLKRAWSAGYRCGQSGPLEVINGKPHGVVRVSLGAMSTKADVDGFLNFLSDTFVEEADRSPYPLDSATDHLQQFSPGILRKGSFWSLSIRSSKCVSRATTPEHQSCELARMEPIRKRSQGQLPVESDIQPPAELDNRKGKPKTGFRLLLKRSQVALRKLK